MTMSSRPQEQSGGDNSVLAQAGRDVHVHGLTVSEARDVALDVFRANALELQGIAQATARHRAEEITNDFLDSLQASSPEAAGSLADPDMQNVVFGAQRDYARSGEEDLREVLVDLLSVRATQEDRSLRTLALNEAIASAPKLTEAQRRSIAWVFLMRYTRDTGSNNLEQVINRLTHDANALGHELATTYGDYQHIEYVGAGTISLSTLQFGAAVKSGLEGFFTLGFPISDLDEADLRRLASAGILTPCVRDMSRLQVNVRAEVELDSRIAELGLQADEALIRDLFGRGSMDVDAVAVDAVTRVPALADVRAVWDAPDSGISHLTLTSVGLALGHAYWARLSGNSSPLSIWL